MRTSNPGVQVKAVRRLGPGMRVAAMATTLWILTLPPSSAGIASSEVQTSARRDVGGQVDWAEVEAQHPDAVTRARVRHNHSYMVGRSEAEDVWNYCEGILFVFAKRVQFDARVATDANRHSFDLQWSDVREVKQGDEDIMGSQITSQRSGARYSAFHLRASDTTNYGFLAPVSVPIVKVLKEIEQVRRAATKR